MTPFEEAQAKLAAMTPAEREALRTKTKTSGALMLAGVAGVGFLVLGPIGLIAAPAGLLGLALLLMGNRN